MSANTKPYLQISLGVSNKDVFDYKYFLYLRLTDKYFVLDSVPAEEDDEPTPKEMEEFTFFKDCAEKYAAELGIELKLRYEFAELFEWRKSE